MNPTAVTNGNGPVLVTWVNTEHIVERVSNVEFLPPPGSTQVTILTSDGQLISKVYIFASWVFFTVMLLLSSTEFLLNKHFQNILSGTVSGCQMV